MKVADDANTNSIKAASAAGLRWPQGEPAFDANTSQKGGVHGKTVKKIGPSKLFFYDRGTLPNLAEQVSLEVKWLNSQPLHKVIQSFASYEINAIQTQTLF